MYREKEKKNMAAVLLYCMIHLFIIVMKERMNECMLVNIFYASFVKIYLV